VLWLRVVTGHESLEKLDEPRLQVLAHETL
jgi:hypothetical protein